MKRNFSLLILLSTILFSAAASLGQQPSFHVLAFYAPHAEPDHVQFAEGALKFFSGIAAQDDFVFDSTTDWANLNESYLKKYQVVIWLNESPTKPEQRHAFEQYMADGGAWLGFHAAGYNDRDTKWPWYVDFLGGAVFETNSWPPLPAKLVVDDRSDPATANTPDTFLAPANEWYVWKPSPRLNKAVRVLLTFDPANYPIGLKDVLTSGDLPAVWTNTKFKMIYMNMGHGDKIFTSPTQNKLFEDALLSLGRRQGAARVTANHSLADQPPARGMRVSPRAVAVNPASHKVYAANPAAGTVTVIDEATHSATSIKVGVDPGAIDINPVTNRIYVANGGSGTVSVIDGATNAASATVPVGDEPYVVAVNPATNKIYVSRTFNNTVTVIDGKTNETKIVKAGVQADAIAVDSRTNKIYLTNYEGTSVTVIDGANDTLTTAPADLHTWGIAVNGTTGRVYIPSIGSSRLTVIDEKTDTASTVDIGKMPCAVAVDAAANKIYTANYGSDSVTVIDGANNSVIANISVGSHPQALAVDSQTHRVYVANTHANTVSVIDGTRNSVVATVNAGSGPYAIAVDTASNKAYVANLGGSVTVIDGNTLTATTPTVSAAKQ
jgi:uncharacterized protein